MIKTSPALSSTPETLAYAYRNSKALRQETLDLLYLIVDDLVRRQGEMFDASSTCFPLFDDLLKHWHSCNATAINWL